MRSSFTPVTGLKLSRTPSVRDEALRRRLAVMVCLLALMAGGVGLGLISAPEGADMSGRTGPFSYFPSQ